MRFPSVMLNLYLRARFVLTYPHCEAYRSIGCSPNDTRPTRPQKPESHSSVQSQLHRSIAALRTCVTRYLQTRSLGRLKGRMDFWTSRKAQTDRLVHLMAPSLWFHTDAAEAMACGISRRVGTPVQLRASWFGTTGAGLATCLLVELWRMEQLSTTTMQLPLGVTPLQKGLLWCALRKFQSPL
jgi:hypothetical protein